MSREIIGHINAGFTIIEEQYTDGTHGYVLGKSGTQYVTWWFNERGVGGTPDFYHGNYFSIDPDAPGKSRAKAYADYYRRLSEALEQIAKYGY